MTLNDIILADLQTKYPTATFSIAITDEKTKKSVLTVNGNIVDTTWCNIDNSTAEKQSTKIVLKEIEDVVKGKLS